MDPDSLESLEAGLRKTMLSTSGAELDAALADLGWADMLSDISELAMPLVFRLLGETGPHASVLNDVVLLTAGRRGRRRHRRCPTPRRWWCGTTPRHRPWAGCRCAGSTRAGTYAARRPPGGGMVAGRCARATLTLARQHALDRVQFGKPIVSFQAVRHRLTATLVAGTKAPSDAQSAGEDNPDLTALLAKAAAGKAALPRPNSQQVLGGIGFTAEHDLHDHVKRALVLDGLLGSSRELTRRAGVGLRARGSVPRLAERSSRPRPRPRRDLR